MNIEKLKQEYGKLIEKRDTLLVWSEMDAERDLVEALFLQKTLATEKIERILLENNDLVLPGWIIDEYQPWKKTDYVLGEDGTLEHPPLVSKLDGKNIPFSCAFGIYLHNRYNGFRNTIPKLTQNLKKDGSFIISFKVTKSNLSTRERKINALMKKANMVLLSSFQSKKNDRVFLRIKSLKDDFSIPSNFEEKKHAIKSEAMTLLKTHVKNYFKSLIKETSFDLNNKVISVSIEPDVGGHHFYLRIMISNVLVTYAHEVRKALCSHELPFFKLKDTREVDMFQQQSTQIKANILQHAFYINDDLRWFYRNTFHP